MFSLCEKVFSEEHELLILVTELTLCPAAARYFQDYEQLEFYAEIHHTTIEAL